MDLIVVTRVVDGILWQGVVACRRRIVESPGVIGTALKALEHRPRRLVLHYSGQRTVAPAYALGEQNTS